MMMMMMKIKWNGAFWCICTHGLYLKSKLVSRSQIRWPRHEEQRQKKRRQGNVRSNTEAITGEVMSSQDLKSTRFAISAINSTSYVL